MYRTLSRFAALAMIAVSIATVTVYNPLHNIAVATYGLARTFAAWIVGHVITAAGLAPKPTGTVLDPERMLTVAKAYRQRIERRQTPTLTASWRMCPSI